MVQNVPYAEPNNAIMIQHRNTQSLKTLYYQFFQNSTLIPGSPTATSNSWTVKGKASTSAKNPPQEYPFPAAASITSHSGINRNNLFPKNQNFSSHQELETSPEPSRSKLMTETFNMDSRNLRQPPGHIDTSHRSKHLYSDNRETSLPDISPSKQRADPSGKYYNPTNYKNNGSLNLKPGRIDINVSCEKFKPRDQPTMSN
jgi:hypothetical protein